MSEPSQTHQPTPIDQATYWNENGGEKWVSNIDHIDVMIGVFSTHLLSAAAARAGEHVLDVGCGGGTTSAALASAVTADGQVTGVDVSKVILDEARRRQADHKNLRFQLGDAATFDFESASFDLMTSRFGVMFFEHPHDAFRNLRTALKRTGRLAFVCWRALAENQWMAAPAAAAFEILPRPEPQDPDAPGPFAFADDKKLRLMLETSGFANVRITAVDELLDMGPLQGALNFLTKMGPAAAALQEASDADVEATTRAIEGVLTSYLRDGRVRIPGAVWLVQADAA